jgi:multidrug transporter EmrE-like cation transporter
MVVEISCLNMIWYVVGIAILALVGGTSAPKDSQKYKAYAKLLGFCILSIFGLFLLSVGLNIFSTSISVVP